MKTIDLILFFIGYFMENNNVIKRPDKAILESTLSISRPTLNRYLRLLSKSGLIEKEKNMGVLGYKLTFKGKDEYDRVYTHIMKQELIPEIHNVTRYYHLGIIVPYITISKNIIKIIKFTLDQDKNNILNILDVKTIESGNKKNNASSPNVGHDFVTPHA